MSIETEQDLERLQRIGRIVRLTLMAMRKQLRPGISTAELDRVGERVLSDHGARSAPRARYGFPGHNCISVNEEVVHGVPGERRIQPGDLVTLDVTAERDGYVADAAFTVVVGPATEEKRRLVACAEASFRAAMAVARAGSRTRDIGRVVEAEARRRGFRVFRDLTGHGVGRAIHEEPTVPNHDDPRCRALLTEGLVLTVEPLVTPGRAETVEGRDGWTVSTADGALAAHHEHTLVITRGRPVLLTAG